MKTVVQLWGDSLALRIPRAYAHQTRISEGSEVELTLKSGALIGRPIIQNKHSLSDLLKRVTADNRHKSVDTKAALGWEVW